MRILWISNSISPDVCTVLKRPVTLSEGWTFGLAAVISQNQNIKLAIATIWDGGEFREYDINGIVYYLLPVRKMTKINIRSLAPFWKDVIKKFQPDLCHIHGTENTHGLACMCACPDLKYVISIQGLISVISRYFYTGIKPIEIIKNITLRDLILMDTLFNGKKKFESKGSCEYEYIKRSKHVIGRTSWDFAHVKTINPDIEYHFCNEVLRKAFYVTPKWNISEKVNFSIFISQAVYPIKGLHQVLKAVALLKSKYGAIQVRVAGRDITKSETLSDKLRLKGYGSYIKELIRKLKLDENVTFTGSLSEELMAEEYRKAHIFICPSSIENSPNSLGEAQIIGTPCIASYVGGIPDMVVNGETGYLYRFEEVEMLAIYISKLFSDDDLANYISSNEIIAATKRHNRLIIQEQILKIYENIVFPQTDNKNRSNKIAGLS
jgi:L-malate glycosyltransferase